ncbi:MAG: TonB-dependent receptor [Phocaeicola sp.]
MVKGMRSFFAAIMLMIAVGINAQVTTASISGKITDATNETIIGATIQAIHEPSGTYYGAITNVDGRYTIQGMRAGGPYKVEISYIGYESVIHTGVNLQLGETVNISAKMKDSSELLDEVVVVGKAGLDATKTGAAMSMSADDISRMPSINRGVADMARMNPQISVANNGSMSFAGANNRYNSFQVDGAMNNDAFGLTGNGSNGGQAGTQPISMETVEQIQISVAPFDVRQSGFTGGAINAVTKSGTNNFKGSVYGFGNNQSLIGRKYQLMNGATSQKYEDQTEYQAGVTFGGPIIKNKLFFFANYEKANKTYPDAYQLGSDASQINKEDAQRILDRLKEMAAEQGVTYNGGFNSSDVYTESDKAGLKLDWNINNKHKASVRWSMVSAKQRNSNSSANNLNATDYSYDFVSKTNTFVAELQSRFNDNLSNEFRASYVRVRDERQPDSPFPMISISNVGAGTLNLGNERSSMANALDQDVLSFTDNLTWYQGNHTFTFGTHNEFYQFKNLFIQDAYGTYYYNNVDDFFAGKINRYRFAEANVSVTGDPRWAPAFGAGQLGFYMQDKWNVTDNFNLTVGIRMDMPLFFDTPSENKEFNQYAESKNWNYRTNHKMKSTPMFSPRVGFRWDINGDGRYTLRGGGGVFTGRIPFVWLSNNFSNTGVQMSAYDTRSTDDLSLILNPYGQGANAEKLTASGSQIINVFDENFKFAQNLRFNLGFDFDFAGIDWTAEAIYSKTLNDILYQNLAYATKADGSTLGQTYESLAFDNRPMLERTTTGTNFAHVYALSNTSEGYSYSLSLSGKKSFAFGLDLTASYSYTQSKSLNSGTSSVAQSNWNFNYTTGNPNAPELGNSAFNRPHQLRASAYYHKDYGKGWRSTVGLIYTGSSGAPYSIYYNGDLNGDSSTGNDLFFIPTDAQIDKMNFKATTAYPAETQRENMKAWIAADSYMSKHRGEYYERYADNEDFEHHFDFHFGQKFSFRAGNSIQSLELTFDIMNVGNMFNKKWGRSAAAGGSATWYSPVTYSGNGEFQFLREADYNMRTYSDYYSRWRGQIGLKYTF